MPLPALLILMLILKDFVGAKYISLIQRSSSVILLLSFLSDEMQNIAIRFRTINNFDLYLIIFPRMMRYYSICCFCFRKHIFSADYYENILPYKQNIWLIKTNLFTCCAKTFWIWKQLFINKKSENCNQ